MTDTSTAAWLLSNPPHGSHIVYPYSDDQRLVDAVGFFTSSGLSAGGAVIIISTEAHRSAIKQYLKSDGNTERMEATGQLSFLDAAELIRFLIVDGSPDPILFKRGIRTLIERARFDEHTGGIRNVRLFGEGVNLLWPHRTEAAECVEQLSNEVAAEYSIPILCGYSVDGDGRSQVPESLVKLHSHSITW